jgi:hypothetical protein
MSFGNATVFPFPAVQYIPLPLTTLRHNRFEALNPQMRTPHLQIGPEIENWQQVIAPFPTGEDPVAFPDASLPVLALNLKIEIVKYRGHLLTMLGRSDPGFYQLASLPRQYFYKDTLFFELYDKATSQLLARSAKYDLVARRSSSVARKN